MFFIALVCLELMSRLDFVGGAMSEEHVPMVGIRDTEVHLRRRCAWNRGLGPGAIKEYKGIIATRGRQLIQRLEEQHGVVALDKWLKYFSCVPQLP